MTSTKIKNDSRLRESIQQSIGEAIALDDDRITFAGKDSFVFAATDVAAVRALPVVVDGELHSYSMYYVGVNRYESLDGEML